MTAPLYADCMVDHQEDSECIFVTEVINATPWRVCIYTFELSIWIALQDDYLSELQFEVWRAREQVMQAWREEVINQARNN